MFKARLVVSEDTDVAVELAKVENLAKRHGLGATKTFSLIGNLETVLADLKQQAVETADYGINMSVSKTLSSEDYHIVVALDSRGETRRKGGPLSWLFGR